MFEPCPNNLDFKETEEEWTVFAERYDTNGQSVFHITRDDDRRGTSAEDREFLRIMDKEMFKGPDGNWVAPLPFKAPRQRLPNNKSQAERRARSLHQSLLRDSKKRELFIDFMKKILDNHYAELAPPLQSEEEFWYLPIFGVCHPKKHNQNRAVFDSSAQYAGVSLNNVLQQGPDLTNDLFGVLLRFRREPVAIMADIQHMFHCFQVREDHLNFLRFRWYEENNPERNLVDYIMRVHVFGNSPSPAVATYGLRKTAMDGEEKFGSDTKEFVEKGFYVDDALSSLPTPAEAVDLLKRTQTSLKTYGDLRLHKIASNCQDVMDAFPAEDLAADFKETCIDHSPLQRSLGMHWDVASDTPLQIRYITTKKCTIKEDISQKVL